MKTLFVRIVSVLPVLLPLVGCGDPATLLGVQVGDSIASVLRARSDLKELTDFNSTASLLTEEAQVGYRGRADPDADPPERILREDYYFHDGKLILAVVVFRKDAKLEEVEAEVRGENGEPSKTSTNPTGGSIRRWDRSGSILRLYDVPGMRLDVPAGKYLMGDAPTVILSSARAKLGGFILLAIVLFNGVAMAVISAGRRRMTDFLSSHEIAGASDLETYQRIVAFVKNGNLAVIGCLGGGVVCGVYGFSQDQIGLGGLALVGVLSAVIAKMGSKRKAVEARFRASGHGL